MQEEAVLRLRDVPSGRTIAIAPTIGYEQFRQMAWLASQEIARAGRPQGVVPVRELRGRLADVPSQAFNQHLLRLERNGLVYLIAPDQPHLMSEEERAGALAHPAGDLRSFLLWLGPKTQPPSLWD
jgi:hypothetical protein